MSASIIISQLGGPHGEMGAATRYLQQRYSMPYGEIIGVLTDIGTEELAHIEMISALMQVVFIQIGRSIMPFDGHEDAGDQRQRKLFEKLRKDIYSAPEKNWTGEKMAANVFLSVNQLITLYKRFFGVTPKQDLLEARIVKAKTLMGPSTIIKEVASNCGFENEYYFSRVFKQKTGMTPSEYAQQPLAALLPDVPRPQ